MTTSQKPRRISHFTKQIWAVETVLDKNGFRYDADFPSTRDHKYVTCQASTDKRWTVVAISRNENDPTVSINGRKFDIADRDGIELHTRNASWRRV